jgi:TPR repeat protein
MNAIKLGYDPAIKDAWEEFEADDMFGAIEHYNDMCKSDKPSPNALQALIRLAFLGRKRPIEYVAKLAADGSTEALTAISTLAEQEDSNALWYLGHIYRQGAGVEQNIEKGMQYLCKAFNLNKVNVLDWFEECLLEGDSEIEACLSTLASEHNMEAQYMLGKYYRKKAIEVHSERYWEKL